MAFKLIFYIEEEPNTETIVVTIIMGLPLVIFPVWSVYFLLKNRELLYVDERIKMKYQGLYSNLRHDSNVDSPWVLLYPTIFTLRRASYVMVAMIKFPSNGMFFNICFLIWLSIIYWSWLGHVKPFINRQELILEISNEMIILYICYHLFCFTELTALEAQVTTIMNSFLAAVALLVIVNLLYMTDTIFKAIRQWYLKRARDKARQV